MFICKHGEFLCSFFFFCFACHIKKKRKEMGVLREILFVQGLLLKNLLVPNLVRQQL